MTVWMRFDAAGNAVDSHEGEMVPAEPRPENPYRTVHARMSPPGAAWDEGFAACRAAFDAVVAERDEAVKKLGIAIDVTHEFEDEKIALADRLAKWERGEWPSTEAQHGVLLDQIKELAAERDAASEVLALIYVMLTGAEPMWAEMPFDERCARAANEAQQAFLAVSGSSEPPKESA